MQWVTNNETNSYTASTDRVQEQVIVQIIHTRKLFLWWNNCKAEIAKWSLRQIQHLLQESLNLLTSSRTTPLVFREDNFSADF